MSDIDPEEPVQTQTEQPRRDVTSTIVWGITGGLIVLIILVVVWLLVRPKPELQKPDLKLANVEVRTVRPEVYRESLVLPARIVADQSFSVATELPGTLAEWKAAEGGTVRAGQVVARLDLRTLRAQYNQLKSQKDAAEAGVSVAKANEELARVGQTRAAREAAAAALQEKAAVSAHSLAQSEFKRTKSLHDEEISSQAELDSAKDRLTRAEVAKDAAAEQIAIAKTGVAAAKVQLQQAMANRKLAEAQLAQLQAGLEAVAVQLEKAVIKSPIAGVLDAHLVDVGEVVNPGQELGRIYDISHVRAAVDVADRYVPFLRRQEGALEQYLKLSLPGAEQDVAAKLIIPGMPRLDGGHGPDIPFDADIEYIAQASDPRSNTFRVELRLKNPDGALKEGMIVRARIDYLVYRDAIVIPMTAIQVTDAGPRCLVVEEADGVEVVRVRRIAPRSVSETRVLVAGELSAGDRLIIAGGKGLIDGEQVKIIKQDGVFLDQPAGPSLSNGSK